MTRPPPTCTELFAEPDDLGGFQHFHTAVVGVRMCGAEHVVKVRLIPDAEGPYWCWHDFERDDYSMVWPSFVQLDMCFPAGVAAAEKRGRGVRARVRVEQVND